MSEPRDWLFHLDNAPRPHRYHSDHFHGREGYTVEIVYNETSYNDNRI